MSIPLQVLILEDRIADVKLIVHELRRANFEPNMQRVETKQDYLAALTPELDLILADYSLPDFDGLLALQLLQERELDIPFILISGTIGEELAVEAMKRGAADYLLKDRLRRLGPAVIRALEQRRLRDEMRQVETALRASEERFRALIEHNSDGIALLDKNGTILYESPAVSPMLGYTVEELVDYPAFELIHPDDLSQVADHFSQILQDSHSTFLTEFRYRHKNDHWLWLEASGVNLLASPAVQAIVVNYRNITERKQTEEALRQQEALLRQMLSTLPIGVWMADEKGQIIYGNPAGQTIWAGAKYVGLEQYGEYKAWSVETGKRIEAEDWALFRAITRGESSLEEEILIQCFDGTYKTILNSAVPVRDNQNRIVGGIVVNQDITERRRAEEALRQSEERYRAFVANSSEGIWRCEIDPPISVALGEDDQLEQIFTQAYLAECNDAFARMYGREKAEELTGVRLEDFLNRSEPHHEFLRAFIQSGYRLVNRETYETDLVNNFHCFVNSLYGNVEQGCLVRAWGVQRDITERKRTEEKIRRRNRELAMLNQIISASVVGLEPATILETACRELALAFDLPQVIAGVSNETKTETVIVAEYRTEGRQSALNQVIPILDNPVVQTLLNYKRPLVVDDAQKDLRLAPFHDLVRQYNAASLLILPLLIGDEVIGSLTLATTQIRHFSSEEISLAWSVADQVAGALARAQLTQIQQRLITAIEQVGEGIVIMDTNGIILYVNPTFERITGYSRTEAIGQDWQFLKSDQHDQAFDQRLWATITAGQVWQGRLINKKKDDTLFIEEVTITPVHDPAKGIVNFVAVKRDVTEQLRLEEQFRQAQKMEAVGRLAGGVAHDFNNLLTVINGYSELLLDLHLEANNPARQDIEQIKQAGERAANLTRQLLAFSRKQILHMEVVDLNSIIVEIENLLRRMIGEDITIVTHLDSRLGRIKADQGQLEQVIMNLGVNARDAMPGGGSLIFETANVTIDEIYACQRLDVTPGFYVLLAVSDSGAGMDKKTLSHIFEPFFTTKAPGKGTGLGLATVHGIVKQSGGHIEVYSEVGHGTTFKIYLPRLEEVEPRAPVLSLAEPLRGAETILLVEDEEGVRDLIDTILKEHGYTVLAAASGAEALQRYAERPGPIDLLLTDVVMPDMNGRNLSERFKALYPQLKVLYMSGYTNNVIVHHGVLEQDTAFIQKPFMIEALTRKVREMLDTPEVD